MHIIRTFDINLNNPTAITIGNFDGIHIGHQKLIEILNNYSKDRNLTSTVISFFPHPIVFFNREDNFCTILSQEEKINELEKLGVDLFIQHEFGKYLSNLSAEDFVKILFEKLKCKVLVIGEGYRFGKDRKGNYSLLKKFGEKYNSKIIKVNHLRFKKDIQKISSSEIKKHILNGDLESTNKLLNKPFYITGEVVLGNQRGRTINFPTANLIPIKGKIILPDGVYATRTEYRERTYNSITNIGNNPTFGGDKKVIETFIFDFNEEIYGEKIKVMFFKYIRKQKKFDSLFHLKDQISKDVEISKNFLKNIKN